MSIPIIFVLSLIIESELANIFFFFHDVIRNYFLEVILSSKGKVTLGISITFP